MTRTEWIVVLTVGVLGVALGLPSHLRAGKRSRQLLAELEADPTVSAAEKREFGEEVRKASWDRLGDWLSFVALMVLLALSFFGVT